MKTYSPPSTPLREQLRRQARAELAETIAAAPPRVYKSEFRPLTEAQAKKQKADREVELKRRAAGLRPSHMKPW